MRRTIRSIVLTAACCWMLLASGQSDRNDSKQRQKDVPQQGPGEASPDLYQDRQPSKDSGASKPQDTAKQKQTNTKANDKKKRNPQSHGPQRHDPNSQVK